MENKKDIYQKYMEINYKYYDLGSPSMLSLIFSKKGYLIFDSNNLDKFSSKYKELKIVGKEIAETILLNLSASGCCFGDWLNSQNLPNPTAIEKLTKDDFYLDVELQKLWIASRVACNNILNKHDNSIYLVDWNNDTNSTMIKKFKDEKEFENFCKECFFDLEEEI